MVFYTSAGRIRQPSGVPKTLRETTYLPQVGCRPPLLLTELNLRPPALVHPPSSPYQSPAAAPLQHNTQSLHGPLLRLHCYSSPDNTRTDLSSYTLRARAHGRSSGVRGGGVTFTSTFCQQEGRPTRQ